MEEKKNKKTASRRTSSVARKINRGYWFDTFFRMIFLDILIVALCVFTYMYKFEDGLDRRVVSRTVAGSTYDTFSYVVSLSDGGKQVLYFKDMQELFAPGWYVLGGFELLLLLFALFRTGRVRKKLRPLNELALTAEKISRVPIDYSKMAVLEAAIENVSAEDENIIVRTGDRDLAGIEIALNNLFRQMQETKRAQARFVSDASHELRTPISVIQGYVNMLDRWGKEDEEVLDESIEALKNESEHMKELIEQLLFLARGDSGRNTLHFADFDLRGTMQEVWEESMMIDGKHRYIYKKALEEEAETADDISSAKAAAESYMINGDEAMIKQSVRILVQNAAKYSKEGDTITLDVSKKDGIISYIVQDEGVGMAEKDVVHIFERFYRSDEARNSGTGGSGLGLSIAKWIIDAHNAEIDVLSRPEFGTRFTVRFSTKMQTTALNG